MGAFDEKETKPALAELVFTTNWNNKLNCNFFTTLRLRGNLYKGMTVMIKFEKDFTLEGPCKIVDKREMKLKDINEWIAAIDTGYGLEETINILKTMYKDKGVDWDFVPIYFYLLKRIV